MASDFLMAHFRPSTRLELTLCISAVTSELGPADMVMLNRPTMRAGGVLASTQDQKKVPHPYYTYYTASCLELSCNDERRMRWPKAGAVQQCSQGDPLLALTSLACFTPDVFSIANEHVGFDAFVSATQTSAKWHNPGWKKPCVFFCVQILLCFQTCLSSSLFLYSNFAHRNVKQQLFGQHFERQLAILAALILKLGFPLYTLKRLLFLLQ